MKHGILFILIFALCALSVRADNALYDEGLSSWNDFSRSSDAKILVEWMNRSMKDIISGEDSAGALSARTPAFFGSFGVFVTLVRGGKTRGCFGAFHHSSDNLAVVLREYLKGALRSDPRYAPLELHECADTHVVITIASQAVPVDDPRMIDLSIYGVKVTCESEEVIVFVPFEVKTYDFLRRSLKGRAVSEYAVFRAVTIR